MEELRSELGSILKCDHSNDFESDSKRNHICLPSKPFNQNAKIETIDVTGTQRKVSDEYIQTLTMQHWEFKSKKEEQIESKLRQIADIEHRLEAETRKIIRNAYLSQKRHTVNVPLVNEHNVYHRNDTFLVDKIEKMQTVAHDYAVTKDRQWENYYHYLEQCENPKVPRDFRETSSKKHKNRRHHQRKRHFRNRSRRKRKAKGPGKRHQIDAMHEEIRELNRTFKKCILDSTNANPNKEIAPLSVEKASINCHENIVDVRIKIKRMQTSIGCLDASKNQQWKEYHSDLQRKETKTF